MAENTNAATIDDFHVGDIVRNKNTGDKLVVRDGDGAAWLARFYELVACPHGVSVSTDTPPTDWGLLRDLLTADHARLEKAAKDNPELGIWYAGIQQGIGYALAYMDGIESEPGGSR